MHLIDCSDLASLRLVEYFGDNIPCYAMLSHTWGETSDEPKFGDLAGNVAESKPGYQKVELCARQAHKEGLGHIWVDTCCIDKTNTVDLSEAIYSMFDWYRRSARC